ncbi:sensor histidine kinase [Enterococcus sp. HY326]|uniref:sensor histidine kinase n=1 Tax=Enterococcus sp. HY326 TaxID=2971265 RepID=UPI002240DB7A|nr:sensor histidine kinase KdpD [Enterococcus sp. HY326]
MAENRPSASELLKKIQRETSQRGRLRVFFGFAAGVGKTYAMLQEAQELQQLGRDVLVGYVEPHDRPETNKLLQGLPQLAAKDVTYRGITLKEFDVDQALAIKPEIILVDELAHTNAPGSRNKKRYQDVEELLQAGINVLTTMNVQHLESLNDLVDDITGVEVQETVPDTVLKQASIKVVDIEPEELIERLAEGKIYAAGNARKALENFFSLDKLDQLRGLAIQRASDYINQAAVTNKVQTKLLTIVEDRFPKMGEKCIRWTARLVQGFGVDWTVVLVHSQNEPETKDASFLLDLGEKLGAETVTLEEDSSYETIAKYAELIQATDIVMGKRLNQKWYERLFVSDPEDILLEQLTDIEIHLVPYQEKGQKTKWWQELIPTGGWGNLMVTLLMVISATIITEILQWFHFGDQNQMMIYLVFVLITARLTNGYLWSGLASILSVLIYTYLFVEPRYSLVINRASYLITLLIMLIVALMVSNLVVRLKMKASSAMEREHQLEILYELNKRYVVATDNQEIYDTATSFLARLLKREIVLYSPETEIISHSPETAQTLQTKEEMGVAFWTGKNQREAGFGTDTLGGAKGYYLPVAAEGQTLAVLGILRNQQHNLENNQLNYLRLVTTQLAIVLEQSRLKNTQQEMRVENEREKVRSNLLRAVSHDLRTPLTSISGLAETLIEDEEQPNLAKATKVKLLQDVKDESQWLVRMVENLLSVTRINMDTMEVTKTPELVEEIAEAVLARSRKAYPEKQLQIDLPAEMLFVAADPILLEQALFNLIENGFRHGNQGTPVKMSISYQEPFVTFQISSQGQMTQQQYQKILHNLSSDDEIPVDSKNGLGIGLSIVKTIIKAHDGQLQVLQAGKETIFEVKILGEESSYEA